MEHLTARGIEVAVNPQSGMLDRVIISVDGRVIEPLHRAPWLDTPDDVPADAAPHLRVLAGDFFCAPFGLCDIEPAPAHGWAANGSWTLSERLPGASGETAIFRLEHEISGARLRKEIGLRHAQPVVYQRHVFEGGHGAVPVSHHVMLHVPGGASLSFSRKDFGATPASPLETDPSRGRSALAYPQRFEDLADVVLADGRKVDGRRYPFAESHEDFISLFDPQDAAIGWSAALAKADGFLFFAIKDAQALPQTSLWLSNGGRSYAPWLSRHRDVLGIEEGCTLFGDGHRASTAPNEMSDAGYRTALQLDPGGETDVRYAFGAIPADPSWTAVADIAVADDSLTITDAGGGTKTVPFDGRFFARSGGSPWLR